MENDYKVADMSLADFGRREISLAENEMPALMALRTRYKDTQPLKAISAGISFSAKDISLLPKSARLISATL